MRKPLVPLLAAAASACIGVGGAGAGTSTSDGVSGAAPEGRGSGTADVDVQVPDSKERIDDYWTQDRMRAAKPTPTPQISRPSTPPAAADDAILEE